MNYARAVARAVGITPQEVISGKEALMYPTTLGGLGVSTEPQNIYSYPGSLISEFKNIPANQVQPFRSTPNEAAFAASRISLYAGIAAHDPTDPVAIAQRIKPIGTVEFAHEANALAKAPALPAQQRQHSAEKALNPYEQGKQESRAAAQQAQTPHKSQPQSTGGLRF